MSTKTPAQRDGKIELCPHQNCGYTCCDFAYGNYIVLYPGEIELAQQQGHSVNHLELQPDQGGGYRAICRASCRSSCDNGYKPLDCASYPFFPTMDETGLIDTGLKGQRCPLRVVDLASHREWVIRQWSLLLDRIPQIADWIRETRLVGYIPITKR